MVLPGTHDGPFLEHIPADLERGKARALSAPPLPAVIYLHGCGGFGAADQRIASAIAQHGFAIFAPSSFAHSGRVVMCGKVNDTVSLRHEEPADALQRVRALRCNGLINAHLPREFTKAILVRSKQS